MSDADEPLPVLDVGDVRLFSHEFADGFLQPPASAIELSPASDLFCNRGKSIVTPGSMTAFKLETVVYVCVRCRVRPGLASRCSCRCGGVGVGRRGARVDLSPYGLWGHEWAGLSIWI